jgi:3-oxoacyl-[acyl-carrier protein] reductase
MPDQIASGTVVITHGARGLGRSIARRFGRAGTQVVIADRDRQAGEVTVGDLRGEGISASYTMLDAAHPEKSQRFIDELVQEVGRISVWVNGLPPSLLGNTKSLEAEVWNDGLSALSTAFYCSCAIAAHMHRGGGGVIVNLTSVAGYLPSEGQVAEGVAAAGLIALTKGLGIEWAASGVRVVGIAVGAVPAESPAIAGKGPLQSEQRRTPMRRLGLAEEVAEATFFIASDEASYIVAETLRVDGGWSAYQMF